MANRNQAKQRRQQQNRARRAQIAARAEATKRKSETAADPAGGRPARTARGVTGATGKGRTRPAAGARPTRERIERGGLLAKFGWNEPGGAAVIVGAGLTLVASVVLLVMKVFPTDGPWEVMERAVKAGAEGAKTNAGVSDAARNHILSFSKLHNVTVLTKMGTNGWFMLASPVVITFLTVAIARPEKRRRTWFVGAIAMFLFVMLFQYVGIFYFVSFGALAFGTYQAYKAARLERMATAAAAPDGIPTTAREARRAELDSGDEYGDDYDDLDGEADSHDTAAGEGADERPQGLFGALFKPRPTSRPAPTATRSPARSRRTPTRSPGRPRRTDRDDAIPTDAIEADESDG